MASSKQYGKALFEITEELGTTERVLSQATAVRELLSSSEDYIKLLDTPAVPKEERIELIEQSFGSLDTNLVNLIKILSEHHMAYILKKVCSEYSALYDASRGIERATVISAVPMSADQMERLSKKLSDMSGKTVKLENKIDPSILGGLKVRFAGKQLDGSVKTRLDSFEARVRDLVI
jgi:F-type H+-transporting ATPase subunit delta